MLELLAANRKIVLKNSQDFFADKISLVPKIGCELEFFLLDFPQNLFSLEELIFGLQEKLIKEFPLIYQIEKEQGAGQIEIKTDFTADLSDLCQQIIESKKFIKDFAKQKNLIASFAAQPFEEDCGSALQFNISLHDGSEKNLFENNQKLLAKTADSLLGATNEMMIFLAPQKEDYRRFSFELNRNLFKKGKYSAPVNLSFGADNRTCAIRVPAKSKRLEYRVAAADSDPFLAISAILSAISFGVNNAKQEKFQQIYGNAFDEQYKLRPLYQSFDEAERVFLKEGNFIRVDLLRKL